MKFFEHYIEFVAGGSREDQTKEDYFHQMEYPADYKMYGTKLIKFDRDYDNELQYNFYGMYPYQISNTPIRYETSQVLKMNVNFHIDRYSSGKYSSYDKYRGRHNNRDETKKAKDIISNNERIPPFFIILRKSVTRFIKCYISRKGYKEGKWGFLIALMASLYILVSYFKASIEKK